MLAPRRLFVAGESDLLAQTSGGEGSTPSLLGNVVRLRGLPFNSTAQDVLQFFEGVDVVGGEPGVVFTCTPDGRPTGEAYVALASDDAQAAALGKHKERIGARYIEIFESSKGDLYQAVQQHGYFTTVGGRRRHHWHQQHGGMAAAVQGQVYPPEAGGGGSGGRGGAMGVDDMTNAFAGGCRSGHRPAGVTSMCPAAAPTVTLPAQARTTPGALPHPRGAPSCTAGGIRPPSSSWRGPDRPPLRG